jgi:membrane protein
MDATLIKPRNRRARLWDFVVRCFRSFANQDTSLRCAGTAFFGFLSLFPAVATAVLVFGLFADRSSLVVIVDALRYVVPSQILELADKQLTRLIDQPRTVLGLGLLISIPFALWSGSRGVDSLLYAMSQVRDGYDDRSFLQKALIAIGLTLVGSVFLLIALITIAGLPALFPWPTGGEWLLLLVRWPVLFVLTLASVMMLYRWGPDRHPRRFRYIWPGALVASGLWIVAGALFSIYVENFAGYQATFGSLTAAIVLLLWLYNSAQIFVLGAVINAELEYGANPKQKLVRENEAASH